MSAGKRILERRKARGLSQEELAFLIGTNQRQISRYERGENDPTGDVLVRIADTLSTTTDYLLERTDNPEPPLRSANDLTDDERELLLLYRAKHPTEKHKAIEILKVV